MNEMKVSSELERTLEKRVSDRVRDEANALRCQLENTIREAFGDYHPHTIGLSGFGYKSYPWIEEFVDRVIKEYSEKRTSHWNKILPERLAEIVFNKVAATFAPPETKPPKKA